MATAVEITSGQTFKFDGSDGAPAREATRVFRILRTSPSEYVDIPTVCQADVGLEHPQLPGLFCKSYQAQYENDSRMVIVATFQYRSNPIMIYNFTAVGDRAGYAPPDRPAKISLSTTLQESPVFEWTPRTIGHTDFGNTVKCRNSAGDLYDGLSRLQPIVTISIQRFVLSGDASHVKLCGKVNSDSGWPINGVIGARRTVMLQAVSFESATETHRGTEYRGFNANYQFAYKRNTYQGDDIGWDILVPQSGHNVIAHQPANPASSNNAGKNDFGQPLAHDADAGFIAPGILPPGVAVGQKMPACIRVFSMEQGRNPTQRVAGLPIPLNQQGNALADNLEVIVNRYQIYDEIDFISTFGFLLN